MSATLEYLYLRPIFCLLFPVFYPCGDTLGTMEFVMDSEFLFEGLIGITAVTCLAHYGAGPVVASIVGIGLLLLLGYGFYTSRKA